MERQIRSDYTQSIKDKDTLKRTTLSLLINVINNKKKVDKIEHPEFLSDDDVTKIIISEVKKRNQSIDLYTQSGRIDLATKEEQELLILQSYLPSPMTEDELKELVLRLKDENPGIIEGKLIGLTNKEVNGRNSIDQIKKVISDNR